VIAALARAPLARLLRTPRTRIAVAGWVTIAVAFAIAERWRGSSHGADRVLLDAYAPLVLPLLAYALVGSVVGRHSLANSAAPLVAFGAPPARAAALAVIVAGAACTIAGALLAAGVDLVGHGSADPPLARDAIACAYAGGLGGAGYAAWFMLGASFGKGGGGRLVLLVVDWMLGANAGAAALVTPRGHLRNLFGGMPPMDLSERASAAALVALTIACALVAVRRARG
jgi:hypothetical protein